MNNRQRVDEQIILNIPVSHDRSGWKAGIRWSELIATKDVLPTDIVSEVGYRKVKESGMFSMKMEDELETLDVATLVVIRNRPETDEEYFQRQQREETQRNQILEREKLEYLRLKAKFENNV